MTGFAITFNGVNSDINLDATVTGFFAVVQNSMLNIVTMQGSDPMYPDRGTGMFMQALGGVFSSAQASQVGCNFAAIDTVFFVNESDNSAEPDRVGNIQLQVTSKTNQQMTYNAVITSRSGKVFGTAIPA